MIVYSAFEDTSRSLVYKFVSICTKRTEPQVPMLRADVAPSDQKAAVIGCYVLDHHGICCSAELTCGKMCKSSHKSQGQIQGTHDRSQFF